MGHGAGWSFIVWGLLHGIGVASYKSYAKLGFKMPKALAWLLTFNFINLTWIFFRADNLSDAGHIIKSMFFSPYCIDIEQHLQHIGANSSIYGWISIAFITIFTKNSIEISKKFKTNFFYLTLTLTLFLVAYGGLNDISEFLYFNF